MDRLFEGIPKSFWVTTFVFMYLFFYLFYIHLRGTHLNTFEFYSISLIPILLVVSVRGSKFFDEFGFNLGKLDKWYVELARLAVLTVVGFAVGYGMYMLDNANFSIFGYHLLPMDVFMIQFSISKQAFNILIDVAIIAFFEEIIRAIGFMGYSNFFYSKGFGKYDSIVYGIILSSLMFVILHYFSWGGINLLSLLVGMATVSLMTFAGYVLKEKEIFGRIAFYEWCIYAPIIAHMTYDYMTFMHLALFI